VDPGVLAQVAERQRANWPPTSTTQLHYRVTAEVHAPENGRAATVTQTPPAPVAIDVMHPPPASGALATRIVAATRKPLKRATVPVGTSYHQVEPYPKAK
jgi:hypothetical protein